MKNIHLLACTLLLLAGCTGNATGFGFDGGGAREDTGPWKYAEGGSGGSGTPSCPGQEVTISGKVLAPNGADPVPGATVFIPSRVPELFPPEVRCEVCAQLGTNNNLWTTTSDYDGSFSLRGVCPGTRTLIFQNGRFRRKITVPVGASKTIVVPPAQSRLPRRNKEFSDLDAIPRIAVATGDYDKMECVLRKLGLPDGTYDLYDGAKYLKTSPAKPAFSTLATSLSQMKKYNIIFINCTNNAHESLLKQAAVRDNLEQYVRAGGRLYVTDWSYDWIEAVSSFAKFIDFEPGPSSTAPEPQNAAAIGRGWLKVKADIKDSRMGQWLSLFNGAIQNGQSLIEHFLPYWVMMYAVGADVKTWVDGVVLSDDYKTVANQRRPLTVTFNFQSCGKILFSSYHTEGREDEWVLSLPNPKPFPNYCESTFSPQDRILEYLIFDIANCLGPIK